MNGAGLDPRRNARRLPRGFLALLAIGVLAEFAVTLHPHFGWDGLFGFHAACGLLACAATIALAKGVRALLGRDERYYEEPEDA